MKKAPDDLSLKAKKFWNVICRNYSPSVEHFLIIEEICRAIDLLDTIRAEIKKDGVILVNPSGVKKQNPLLRSETETSNRLLANWKALNFHVDSIPAIIKDYSVGIG